MPLAAACPHNLWSDISTWDLAPSVVASELPGVAQGRLCPVSGGTKQYERFRDTIFLNYWAIVFVQDVVFRISFSCYFHVFM